MSQKRIFNLKHLLKKKTTREKSAERYIHKK